MTKLAPAQRVELPYARVSPLALEGWSEAKRAPNRDAFGCEAGNNGAKANDRRDMRSLTARLI
jgi:hypothetical protein